MISEKFSAQRFGKYFKYDLKQLWHNNGKAAIGLGFISVICYIIWVSVSLSFTGSWQAPGIAARLAFFYLGALILMFYQTRTYGYLTEKKAGQSWLMLPASTLEKFVSMMIITVVVIPCAYLVSYLALDAIIGLLDPTAGTPIIAGYSEVSEAVNEAMSAADSEGFHFNLAVLAFPVFLQMIANLLYFLLCGICFKKWKIMGGIGVLLALEMVLAPFLTHIAFKYWTPAISNYDYGDDPVLLTGLINSVMNYAIVIDGLLVVGLAIGIYYRLKTLKH